MARSDDRPRRQNSLAKLISLHAGMGSFASRRIEKQQKIEPPQARGAALAKRRW
jgi:hypothetical protein